MSNPKGKRRGQKSRQRGYGFQTAIRRQSVPPKTGRELEENAVIGAQTSATFSKLNRVRNVILLSSE